MERHLGLGHTVAILLTDVWLWTPWFALLLRAGLESLPAEPFEAAQIDAASRRWREHVPPRTCAACGTLA